MILFLESAAASADTQVAVPNMAPIMLLTFAFILAMLFFSSRRDSKKRKKVEEMRNSLSLGEEITTIGGITGKVVQVTEETVTFETGEDRVRIQVKKWAISTTAKMEAEEAANKR